MTKTEKIKIELLCRELSSEEDRKAYAAEEIEHKHLAITGAKSCSPELLICEIATSTEFSESKKIQYIQTIISYIEAKSMREGALLAQQILI